MHSIKFQKQEQVISISKPEVGEIDDTEAATQVESFTIKSIPSAVVNVFDDLEISDDYCE